MRRQGDDPMAAGQGSSERLPAEERNRHSVSNTGIPWYNYEGIISGKAEGMLDRLESYKEGNRLEAESAQGGLPRSLWETCSALANCLTNANCHERRGVVCLWEQDAITIANPGDFRVDIDAALQGGEPDPRNANMMRMFSYIDIGERAGSGLPKIMSGWESCGYAPPRYEESFGPDRTKLTLPLTPNRFVHSSTGRVDESSGRIDNQSEISERAATKTGILDLVKQEGSLTRAEAMEATGLGKSWVSKLLNELVEDGLLIAEGTTRDRIYRTASDDGRHE